MLTWIKTFSEQLKSKIVFQLVKIKHGKKGRPLNKANEQCLAELKSKGYCVVENYLDAQTCNELCRKIDSVIERYPESIWSGHLNADQRIFGIEHVGGYFQKYFSDPDLQNVGENYFGGQLSNLQTLAGKITFKDGNMGSGEGWHRDGNNFQYKTILYLSDVSEENGPFQVVKTSHRFWNILSDTVHLKKKIESTRFTSEEINELIKKDPERLLTFTAKAGTLLFVDTSLLHRGSPIKNGTRYALTNYYYPSYLMHIYENHFTPRLIPGLIK